MEQDRARARLSDWLAWAGAALFAYALLGNYLVLPGYLRFLARAASPSGGQGFDLALAIGAAKTILWMLSFQLGTLSLVASQALRRGLHMRALMSGLTFWLLLWTWPKLPAPGALFYVTFGSIILAAIATALARGEGVATGRVRQSLFLASLAFFAFATWEICGLGSAGRMLHPEQASQPFAHNLLVTQSSKLMIELVLAWSLLALSHWPARSEG